jgi:hypothetical protein
MAACFAGLALLYTLFAKLFPVIAIWEIKEEAHEPAQTEVSIPAKMPEVAADAAD